MHTMGNLDLLDNWQQFYAGSRMEMPQPVGQDPGAIVVKSRYGRKTVLVRQNQQVAGGYEAFLMTKKGAFAVNGAPRDVLRNTDGLYEYSVEFFREELVYKEKMVVVAKITGYKTMKVLYQMRGARVVSAENGNKIDAMQPNVSQEFLYTDVRPCSDSTRKTKIKEANKDEGGLNDWDIAWGMTESVLQALKKKCDLNLNEYSEMPIMVEFGVMNDNEPTELLVEDVKLLGACDPLTESAAKGELNNKRKAEKNWEGLPLDFYQGHLLNYHSSAKIKYSNRTPRTGGGKRKKSSEEEEDAEDGSEEE